MRGRHLYTCTYYIHSGYTANASKVKDSGLADVISALEASFLGGDRCGGQTKMICGLALGCQKHNSYSRQPTAINPCWRLLGIHDSLANAPVASNSSCAHSHSQCCRLRRHRRDSCYTRRSLSRQARCPPGRPDSHAFQVDSEPCLVQQLGSILATRQRSGRRP